MELFGDKRVSITFDKASLKRTKEGEKLAKMRFAVLLEAAALIGVPPEIKAGFEATENHENGITKVELGDKQLSGVNVELYNLPDSRSVSMALQSVNLTDLTVERAGKSPSYLFFTIDIQIGEKKNLRYWIVDNCFNQLWAKFESAQRILIPTQSSASTEDRVN